MDENNKDEYDQLRAQIIVSVVATLVLLVSFYILSDPNTTSKTVLFFISNDLVRIIITNTLFLLGILYIPIYKGVLKPLIQLENRNISD